MCFGCGVPTHFPTSPSPFLTSPPHPNTLSYTFHTSSHISPSSPAPKHIFYYSHVSPHLLKVWRSYHVTKFLWRVTGNHLLHRYDFSVAQLLKAQLLLGSTALILSSVLVSVLFRFSGFGLTGKVRKFEFGF